ncbi:MAG: aquaporin family protein [Zunongwangia sp.]|jgi:glycerol uptake facilitator protein|uniref:Glycerol diffusion channel n=2 Tax=Zunongwangia profunda TaxID=398743 RepID=D5BGF9_ZUNPS|nr:MIP/aquaporin family protein [Zunongwangia profunda]MAC65655.1 aquaporin family protein [Flavobacteriaceae bacterium]MAO35616.1 aquaporin family protein [Zunongwangia sp.]ADF51118.1 putative glycerol diffusion channel [Zunongwangia profunda SM-A87]MAG88221.1 aquaporin family protein [Flavobacteriaceae bacterium]MAS72915.1 aquaporin family protein [Zunongwangia sp.]|tara:strand:+ start:10437 stop:11177 length:741 start_codon:yes stop_codon:yes gene_type:complete
MTPFIAEILGTALLILLGGGVVANVNLNKTIGQGSDWIVITTAWGLAVFAGVVVAGPYSGAHLNPAVTIGLAIGGLFPWADVPIYIAGEFIGAMIGSFLVYQMYKSHFDATEDGGAKRAVFCTAPAIPNTFRNLISEILGTFVLIIAVFYFADASFETQSGATTKVGLGAIGAIPVSFIVWGIGLSLGGTTGYAINPARDLGPRIVHALLPIKGKTDNGWGYAWIPVVGPIIGAAIAAVLFLILGK